MTTGSWWPPFADLSDRERGRRLLVLLAVLLVSLALMQWAMPDNGPGDIIGFEEAGADGAQAYLDAWREPGLWRVALALLVDFPFLVAYGFGGALVIDWLADRCRPEGWSRFLALFAWSVLLAAAFDGVENLALLVVLTERIEPWADVADTCARIKFDLLNVAAVGAGLVLASAVVTRLWPTGPRGHQDLNRSSAT